ncbi:MAG: MYXO-CTERM sorting domain-containing protein [Planctomycetota bacterium]
MFVFTNGSMDYNGSPSGTPNGDGSYDYSGALSSDMWTMENYQITADPDPFVSLAFGFQNTTAMTQTFTVSIVLPVIPIGTPTLIGGSVDGTLTDTNFDGIGTLTDDPSGAGVYTGLIDGVSQLSLLNNDGSPFTASVPFQGGGTNFGESAGLPGPTLPGPSVASTIGIDITFTLTPGDSASFTAFFVVVPTPGALALFGVAALGTRRRRRRA